MKIFCKIVIICCFLILSGCFQVTSGEDDLDTTPVTNNPRIVPNHGGALPGIPSDAIR